MAYILEFDFDLVTLVEYGWVILGLHRGEPLRPLPGGDLRGLLRGDLLRLLRGGPLRPRLRPGDLRPEVQRRHQRGELPPEVCHRLQLEANPTPVRPMNMSRSSPTSPPTTRNSRRESSCMRRR